MQIDVLVIDKNLTQEKVDNNFIPRVVIKVNATNETVIKDHFLIAHESFEVLIETINIFPNIHVAVVGVYLHSKIKRGKFAY